MTSVLAILKSAPYGITHRHVHAILRILPIGFTSDPMPFSYFLKVLLAILVTINSLLLGVSVICILRPRP